MKVRSMAVSVMTLSVAAVGGAAAQTPARLAEQVDLIVRVEPSGRTPGSGLIIAVESDRIRILTARHVIEGDAAIPLAAGGEIPNRRACVGSSLPVRVVFRFAKKPEESIAADCSDTIDAAIVEVARPAAFNDSIPPFSAQRSLADQPGSQVFLAGMAQGANWTHLPGAVSSKSQDSLQIRGVGIGPGFSGGAVFDREFGLIGMIVSASDAVVHAVPAGVLNQWLVKGNVRTTHLEGAATQPDNPQFAASASPGPREENARNAIRRYRGAFANMDATLVTEAYPAIGKQPLRLFGDASRVGLALHNCSDINPDATPPVTKITCAYDLNVTRKTGPPFHAASCDFPTAGGDSGRMVFALKPSGQKDDPFGWEIAGISVADAAACPAGAKPK